MDFRLLTYFIEVANQKSFTKAAQKIHISQPALSKNIQTLEEEIGANLFIREPGKITLTETGQLFLSDATELIAHFNLLTAKYKTPDSRSFVIGCAPFLGYLFADRIINYFQKNQQAIPLTFFETAVQPGHQFLPPDADLALCLICQKNTELSENLCVDSVFKGRFVALVPRSLDISCRFLEDIPLKSYNIVTVNELFKTAGKYLSDRAASVFYTNHADFILNSFLNKQAIAVLPDFAIPFFDDPSAILDFIVPIEYEIAFIYKKQSPHAPQIKSLRHFFMANFPK